MIILHNHTHLVATEMSMQRLCSLGTWGGRLLDRRSSYQWTTTNLRYMCSGDGNRSGSSSSSYSSSGGESSIHTSSASSSEKKPWSRTKREYALLQGCRTFASRSDIEEILQLNGIRYESFEPLLDYFSLGVTHEWAVKLQDDVDYHEEVKKFDTSRALYPQRGLGLTFRIPYQPNWKEKLASAHDIDNTCVRIKLQQPLQDTDVLHHMFENHRLCPHRPLTVIKNGLRVDPCEVQKDTWNSALYIAKFTSPLEAERAVFETGFTVFKGVRSSFFWYDI